MPVKCFTIDGGFVVAGEIPPFRAGYEPDVLFWGARVFRLKRTGDGAVARDGGGALVYVEAFAVTLTNYTEVRK
jgi:hypothetical protein